MPCQFARLFARCFVWLSRRPNEEDLLLMLMMRTMMERDEASCYEKWGNMLNCLRLPATPLGYVLCDMGRNLLRFIWMAFHIAFITHSLLVPCHHSPQSNHSSTSPECPILSPISQQRSSFNLSYPPFLQLLVFSCSSLCFYLLFTIKLDLHSHLASIYTLVRSLLLRS